MAHRIRIYPSAKAQLENLSTPVQERIRQAVDEKLAQEPCGPWAKRLKGERDLWRLRVGDYRIIYQVREDGEVWVLIVWVGHRRDVYDDFS